MKSGWQQNVARAASPIMAVAAAALVLFVTVSPSHADTRTNIVLPEVMPEAIASLRTQPAIGPEHAPGAQQGHEGPGTGDQERQCHHAQPVAGIENLTNLEIHDCHLCK